MGKYLKITLLILASGFWVLAGFEHAQTIHNGRIYDLFSVYAANPCYFQNPIETRMFISAESDGEYLQSFERTFQKRNSLYPSHSKA